MNIIKRQPHLILFPLIIIIVLLISFIFIQKPIDDWCNYYGVSYTGYLSNETIIDNSEINFNNLIQRLENENYTIDYSEDYYTNFNHIDNSTIKFTSSENSKEISGFIEISNNSISLYISYRRASIETIDADVDFNISTQEFFDEDVEIIKSQASNILPLIANEYGALNLDYEEFERISDGPFST